MTAVEQLRRPTGDWASAGEDRRALIIHYAGVVKEHAQLGTLRSDFALAAMSRLAGLLADMLEA